MALAYDGTQQGITANATMTPGATTGTNITFTSSIAIFDATMPGREIRGAYDGLGAGGGRAIIRGFVDSTHVLCDITAAFPTTTAIPAGSWLLTAQTVSGLDYLEGETVGVVCDGGVDADKVVTNGQITTTFQSSVIFVGYKYTGSLEFLNLDTGGQTGSTEAKARNITRVAFNFFNALGTKFGTTAYNTETINFKKFGDDLFDRPTPPFSGIRSVRYTDEWAKPNNVKGVQKKLVVIQDQPLPCTILSADIFAETSDEPG